MTRRQRIWKLIYYAIMAFMLVALIDSYARSEPYAVYKPDPPVPKVIAYQLEINGEFQDITPNVVNDGTQLVYDLKDVPVGANIIRARAQYEHWGWVEWSDPFTVLRPSRMEAPTIMSNPPPPFTSSITPADGIR